MGVCKAACQSQCCSQETPWFPVAANQRICRTVVVQFRISFAFQFLKNALRQNLTELYPPLVKRIDLPNAGLGKDRVLIESNELTQLLWPEPFGKNNVRRAVALKYPMRYKPCRRFFCSYLFTSLSKGECFRLSENMSDQDVMMPSNIVQGFSECDEVAWDKTG